MYVARIIHYVECLLIIQKASQIICCRHSGVRVSVKSAEQARNGHVRLIVIVGKLVSGLVLLQT